MLAMTSDWIQNDVEIGKWIAAMTGRGRGLVVCLQGSGTVARNESSV
jgi:hypothetical protein